MEFPLSKAVCPDICINCNDICVHHLLYSTIEFYRNTLHQKPTLRQRLVFTRFKMSFGCAGGLVTIPTSNWFVGKLSCVIATVGGGGDGDGGGGSSAAEAILQ